MSVPFSNTHLRVPRGFGALLEGLTREILRDQPDNIPAYAAQYFDKLLKEREESGMDPSEWAAKLEDRFYNNHAFKSTETVGLEKETATEEAHVSKRKPSEFETEEEPSHSVEDAALSTEHLPISDITDSAEGSQDEETELQDTEQTSEADEQSGIDKDYELTEAEPSQIIGLDSEVDDDLLHLSLIQVDQADETSDVSEGESPSQRWEDQEYKDEDQPVGAFGEQETVGSEEEHTVESESLQSVLHLTFLVDASASKPGETKTSICQDDTYSAEETETITTQLEENAVELPANQYEIHPDTQQEAKDEAQSEKEITDTESEREITETQGESEVTETLKEKEITETKGEGEITETQGEGKITETLGEREITETQGEREVTETLKEKEITETKGEGEITETQGEGKITETPGERDKTETPGEREITETQGEREVTETLKEKEITETQGEGKITETQGEGKITETPGERDKTETLKEKEITETKGEGEITETQGEGKITETPGERDKTETQGEREVTETLKEKEITETQGEGEITETQVSPEKSSVSPTVSEKSFKQVTFKEEDEIFTPEVDNEYEETRSDNSDGTPADAEEEEGPAGI
uniref:RIIa domain-containing protein n=1 Tax=Xiphophorus maculatus TaxID=8083 RepID=A0A3B5Q1U8_XIPMA